jgi:hypothetical protein
VLAAPLEAAAPQSAADVIDVDWAAFSDAVDPKSLFLDFSFLAGVPGATAGIGWDFHVSDTTTISVEGEYSYWTVDEPEVLSTFRVHEADGEQDVLFSIFAFDSDNGVNVFMLKVGVDQSLVEANHNGFGVYANLGVGGGEGTVWQVSGGLRIRWGNVMGYIGPTLFDGDTAGIELGIKLNF